MPKDNVIEMVGTVTAAKGNGMFEVELQDEMEGLKLILPLSGKVRRHSIKINEGAVVKVELSAYDMTSGRIVYRIK